MTQKSRVGGMSAEDYGKRRLAHEKQAWNIGLSLLKKIGIKLSDVEKHLIKEKMKLSLSMYQSYYADKYNQGRF